LGLCKELTSAQNEIIIASKKLVHNNTEIAKVVGCHQMTITRYLAAYESGEPSKK